MPFSILDVTRSVAIGYALGFGWLALEALVYRLTGWGRPSP